MTRLLAVAVLALAGAAAHAEVYRWVDKDGVVHYTDKPPNKDAKPAQLPPLQTISSGVATKPATAAGAADPLAAAAGPVITIVAPAAEETIRGAERNLTVSVSLQKPLPEGAGLIYYVDGNAQNTPPITSFSYTVSGLERGSHILTVAAVDAAGKELSRSAPVIVHVKPPIAR